jgi:hypothetical protein
MKTKIYRTTEITNERIAEVCFALRQSLGSKVSENTFVNRAINYYLDNELYHTEKERIQLSTGGDLRCK